MRKNEFVESVIARRLSLDEIVSEARAEIHRTESSSHRVKGAPDSRALGSGEYLRFLGSVVFFFQRRKIPAVLSADNFQLLHRLTQYLVDRGDLKPEILELFSAGG